LNILSIINWNAPLGTAINVVVSGEVALISNRVEENTAHDPIAPHRIMNQKKGTSKKGMLRSIWLRSPEMRIIGVRRMIEIREV